LANGGLLTHISPLIKTTKGYKLFIRLTPRSSKDKMGEIIMDREQSYIKIYVRALPEDNKANQALISFLSKTLKVPKSNIDIITGHTSRFKVLEIQGEIKNNLALFNR
jgi:uncharacterized protein (TIGR00251 family)